MALLESVRLMEDYLTDQAAAGARSFRAADNQKASSPGGKSQAELQNKAATNSLTEVKKNPVIAMGVDTANQFVTGVTQSLVAGATKQLASVTAPLQGAVQGFFNTLATVSTFTVELAMELARNSGRNLLKELTNKDRILNELSTEITALYNAVLKLTNSEPFLNAYLAQLLEAYRTLQQADQKFAGVIRTLQRSSRFNDKTFDSGVRDLGTARALILPDTGADVTSIRGLTDFAVATATRTTSKDAVAAAAAIPGISYRIGQLLIELSSSTTNINLLLTNFLGALEEFISSYERNTSIDKVVIDHISSGRSQLGTLLNDMSVLLFPTTEVAAQPLYGAKVTSSASIWGLKVTTIEEWMKLNPGKGSAKLDKTGESVRRYEVAVALLTAMGDRPYAGGVVPVEEAQEDGYACVKVVTDATVFANTVIVRQVNAAEVRAKFTKARNHVRESLKLDADIRAAITPFVKTPSAITGGAGKVLGDILGFANNLGLDRVAGLIQKGAVGGLLSVTPETATTAGASILGINNILKALKSNVDTTDQEIAQIEDLRDEVNREQANKLLEAQRSTTATADDSKAQTKSKQDRQKRQIDHAKSAARRADEEANELSLNEATSNRVSQTTPNYGVNAVTTG